MTKTVTANYRDRTQKNFLVRDTASDVEDYKIVDRVLLGDFSIEDSNKHESGFGCNRVAIAKYVVPKEICRCIATELLKEKLVSIVFDGVFFVEKESRAIVNKGSFLLLDETGAYYMPSGIA